MEFGEVQALVIDTTHRPDKLSEIKVGINAAIAFFASANFPQDLVEVTDLSIDSAEFAQSFAITDGANFTRFKKICYVRPSGYSKNLDFRTPDKIFQNGRECLDVWYRSGNNIIFKLSRLQSTLKVGYYQYHEALVDDDDTDWILDQYHMFAHDWAASRILKAIGEEAEAVRLRNEAMLLWESAKGELVDHN